MGLALVSKGGSNVSPPTFYFPKAGKPLISVLTQSFPFFLSLTKTLLSLSLSLSLSNIGYARVWASFPYEVVVVWKILRCCLVSNVWLLHAWTVARTKASTSRLGENSRSSPWFFLELPLKLPFWATSYLA